MMARYGSPAIRGHGIPEAMEQVLLNESRIPPRVTFLKPLSAAIAIGTGGPVRRRRPDHRHRRGARLARRARCSTSSATSARRCSRPAPRPAWRPPSAAPVSAVLLAVELLLFEYRPALAHSGGAGAPRRRPPARLAFDGAGAGVPDAGARRAGRAPRWRSTSRSAPSSVSRRCWSRAPSTRSRTPSSVCRCIGCGGRRSAPSRSASSATSRPRTLGVGYDNIEDICRRPLGGRGAGRARAR